MEELTKIYFVYTEKDSEDGYYFIKIGYFTSSELANKAIDEYCSKVDTIKKEDINIWECELNKIIWDGLDG